jgi:hypothetical protein
VLGRYFHYVDPVYVVATSKQEAISMVSKSLRSDLKADKAILCGRAVTMVMFVGKK